jgi:hypothetical protein
LSRQHRTPVQEYLETLAKLDGAVRRLQERARARLQSRAYGTDTVTLVWEAGWLKDVIFQDASVVRRVEQLADVERLDEAIAGNTLARRPQSNN